MRSRATSRAGIETGRGARRSDLVAQSHKVQCFAEGAVAVTPRGTIVTGRDEVSLWLRATKCSALGRER